MGVPRLVAVELTYGCHNGRFTFPSKEGPVVILGPNGTGKTTLMEALVLTLYGMDLRKEPKRLESRLPWNQDECRSTVVVADEHGAELSVERDFRTQAVVVRDVKTGREEFRGDASPAAANSEASRYRRWLAEHLGLEERTHYENTACVNQGELVRTRLGEHLLLLAAGGHRDVTTALAEIETRYYELSQEPLVEGDRRRLRGGRLEEVEEEVAHLEERLAGARQAQAQAEPILREQGALNREHAILTDELARLEAGLPILVQRRTLKHDRDHLTERIGRLEGLQRDVGGAQLWVESSQQAWALFGEQPQLPDDFRERTAALLELWPRRSQAQSELAAREAELAEIEIPPLTAALVGSFAVALAGGALVLAGQPLVGAGIVGVSVLAALAFTLWRRTVGRRWREAITAVEEAARRLKELEDRVQRKLRGMPDGGTFGPETVADRQLRFETERKARQAQDDARRRLADGLVRATDELVEATREDDSASTYGNATGSARDERRDGGLRAPLLSADSDLDVIIEQSKHVQARIARALVDDRNALASKELELRRALAGPLALPPDVPAEADAVEAAVRQRRSRRAQIEERLRALDHDLWEHGRAAENPVALEGLLRSARNRWAECARQVEVYRRAHALVRDAYTEFHLRDQERLLRCISNHLTGMTAGVLGPLEAEDSLDAVRIRASNRLLPLESPPLSYGEFHAALLAVRLGAADFLAGTGVRPPFLVDEPFTHLDEERSASVWRLLTAIARDRQVIVATQDRLVLDSLGIVPDIVLARAKGGQVRDAAGVLPPVQPSPDALSG